jgi:hypothetical protein
VECAQHLFVASCRNDASRTQDFGDLYRQLARDAGGAKDQHGFASGELPAVLQRQPGRHAGIGNGRGSDIVQLFRDRKTLNSPNHRVLGHRAVRPPRSAEEHTRAIFEPPHAIHAADNGKFARAGVVRSGRHLFVHRLQRSRGDMYEHFTLARNWIGKFLKARRFAGSM